MCHKSFANLQFLFHLHKRFVIIFLMVLYYNIVFSISLFWYESYICSVLKFLLNLYFKLVQPPFHPEIMATIILGIESSCDDTSAAVISDGLLLSNVIASQKIHELYGGVVPELASRAHQQNIVPVVSEAIKQANINKEDLSAIAFTRGPGLLGSLLVGTSFAKGLSIGLGKPLIDVNHLQAHVLSHFVKESENDDVPEFPYLTLLVSGGNSQLIWVNSAEDMEIIGSTIDDAAGEAFDKCAKVIGLPYPGGPHIDRLARTGDSKLFHFSKPRIQGFDYSFSGLKTSFLYTIRDGLKKDSHFIEKYKNDLAASLQRTIIEILLDKLEKAVKQFKPTQIAIGGGVSANSGIREAIRQFCCSKGIKPWIPKRQFTTDNAAMVAIAGHFKYESGDFCDLSLPPFARIEI